MTDMVNEMSGVEIPRVDAVEDPAHGMPFLIAKSRTSMDRAVDAIQQVHEAALRARTPRVDGKVTKGIGEVTEDLAELTSSDEITPGDANEDAGGTVEATHPGDPDEPGSPAWEAVDAATARAVTAKLTWLRGVVQGLQDREATEVATGADSDPMMAGADTGETLSALDCAIRAMAHFAAIEQGEADTAADAVADQAEQLGIAKSNSVGDEDTNVDTVEKDAAPVVKADGSPDDQIIELMTKLAKTVPDSPAAQAFLAVAKTAPDAPAADAPEDAVEAPDPATPAVPVENAADGTTVVAPGAEAPAVAAAAPAAPADNEYVQKALARQREELEKLFTARLKEAVAPLQAQVQKMLSTPRQGGPMVNGQRPDANPTVTRGHDAAQADPYDAIRKSLDQITDPAERETAALEQSQALMKILHSQR